MNRVAERVEDRGDLVGNVVGDRYDIVLGMARCSPNAPGQFTPTPSVFRAKCPLPARQFRQSPQTISPSPETRWPTLYSVTPRRNPPPSQRTRGRHHRHWHCLLRPLVPVVDMDVGAAVAVFFT